MDTLDNLECYNDNAAVFAFEHRHQRLGKRIWYIGHLWSLERSLPWVWEFVHGRNHITKRERESHLRKRGRQYSPSLARMLRKRSLLINLSSFANSCMAARRTPGCYNQIIFFNTKKDGMRNAGEEIMWYEWKSSAWACITVTTDSVTVDNRVISCRINALAIEISSCRIPMMQ